jgi:hypothetical protein
MSWRSENFIIEFQCMTPQSPQGRIDIRSVTEGRLSRMKRDLDGAEIGCRDESYVCFATKSGLLVNSGLDFRLLGALIRICSCLPGKQG